MAGLTALAQAAQHGTRAILHFFAVGEKRLGVLGSNNIGLAHAHGLGLSQLKGKLRAAGAETMGQKHQYRFLPQPQILHPLVSLGNLAGAHLAAVAKEGIDIL